MTGGAESPQHNVQPKEETMGYSFNAHRIRNIETHYDAVTDSIQIDAEAVSEHHGNTGDRLFWRDHVGLTLFLRGDANRLNIAKQLEELAAELRAVVEAEREKEIEDERDAGQFGLGA